MTAHRKKVVAIHQPNYAPWLGYFDKMARADVFVFLDDAQFTKGSYINRVQIAANGTPRWLTVPVRHAFGAPIKDIAIAREDWARAHLDTLRNAYANAANFRDVWRDVVAIYEALAGGVLAEVNIALVMRLAERLGLKTQTLRASSIDTGSTTGDDRLIAICAQLGDEVTYLSGKGGASYQDGAKFAAASIDLRYSNFKHPTYAAGGHPFVPGLSVLDAALHLGWSGAAALLKA